MVNTLKKVLSFLVAWIMVLSLVPAVYAETAIEEISVGTTEEINAVIDRLAAETGLVLNVTLTADIAMTKQIELVASSAHTVTIDLNSHKLTAKDDAAIRVLSMFDGSVTVKNGTIEMPGIYETTTDGNTGAGMGGLIFVMGDDLVLENVTVKKIATDNMAGDGGIVCLRSAAASMEMIHATIQAEIDEKPDASVGGALRVTNGAKLYMRSGSVIRDGYATGYGGNIAVAGSSQIYVYDDSLITGGICDDLGGNIYLGNANARFHVYHGTISDGEAVKGGNINIGGGRFFLYAGTISGGTANENEGSGVFLKHNTNVYFYLVGGQILHSNPDQAFVKGSSAKARFYNGKTVFDPSAWTPGDCAYVTAPAEGEALYTVTHVDVEGMEVTGSTCQTSGSKKFYCDICQHSYAYVLPLADHTEVTDEAVAPGCETTGKTEGKHCSVCGEVLVAQEEIPSTGHCYEGVYTDPTFEADGYTTYTCTACGGSYVVTDEGSKLTAVATADEVPYQTLQEAVNAGGNVVLLQDVVMTEKLTVNGTVALNLGGKQLTLAAIADNYGMVVKGSLTIEGEGNIHSEGTYGVGVAPGGSLKVVSGTFTAAGINDYVIGNFGTTEIYGGTVQGIYCAVNNFQGTTTIYGGEFTSAAYDYTGEYEAADIMADAGLSVQGGTYSKPVDAAYCAEGYCPKDNGDGTYTVTRKAAITTQPASIQASAEEIAVFTVEAVGEDLQYVWEYTRDGIHWYETKMDGCDTNAVSVPASLTRDGYQYRCTVTDIYGNAATSEAATLTVAQPDGAVKITAQPEAKTVVAGEHAAFTVVAEGDGLSYKWQYRKNGESAWYNTSMEGCNTASLQVTAIVSRNGYAYRCVVTDAYGNKVTTEEAALSVTEGSVSTSGPADQIAQDGKAVFTVAVEGEGLTYRWQYSRPGTGVWYYTRMSGYNTNELTVDAIPARNGYLYRCIIIDAYGNETVSDEAELIVE